MIILSETTDNLEVVLGGAVTTNQLQCVTSWRDRTSTTFVAGRTLINTNNTTDVDISGSPAASTQRIIDTISVYNKDTVNSLVTIKFNANGTEYILWKNYLSSGQELIYSDELGWTEEGGYKPIKSFTVHGSAGANFALTNSTLVERLAGATSRHLFMVDLLGYSQVRLRANVQVSSASASTPVFRVKYASTWNAAINMFTTLTEISLSSVTYVDTGWVNLPEGAKRDGICIAFADAGGDGALDPALGATDILFR